MRNLARLLLAAAVVAGGLVIMPGAGQAACETGTYDQIYVFSRVRVEVDENTGASAPTVAPEAACLVLTPDDGIDPRYIYPGSNSVSVRYTTDLGDSGLELRGTLNGLGLTDHVITLERSVGTTGDVYFYDSETVFIDPTAMGELVVAIEVPVAFDDDGNPIEFETLTDTYRTAV